VAASFVADLFTSPVTDVTSSTTIAGATNTAVSAGNTVFLFLSARGGTTTGQCVTISGLPGDAVIEGNGAGGIGTLQSSRTVTAGSPAVACLRVYLPTGMTSATTITGTWAEWATRKAMDGVVWTGVANSNLQASAVAEGSGAPVTTGTTGATTTTTGVHCVAWGLNSTLSTNSGASEADTEGSMNERTDQLVGASTFHYLMAADRVVTAAHAGGETATITITNAVAGWVGVQAIWDGATAVVPPQKRFYFPSKARRPPQQRNRSHVAWR
jgi:hypothetical protein